jgi:predicted O-methyltransferase YrrM
MSVLNILRNVARPGYLSVMVRKVSRRVIERRVTAGTAPSATKDWCSATASSCDAWARTLDPTLWAEATSYAEAHETYAQRILPALGVDMGGGGHFALLYFLVRRYKPQAVLETGVAAGHSSRAVLTALRANGTGGRLLSSDFPYFRMANPESRIGILVEPDLRGQWQLEIRGDDQNLPALLAAVPSIDLFHYDSDKTVAGRQRALDLVRPKLSAGAIVIFDDIQDNPHFQGLAKQHPGTVRVFEFYGKYIGMLLPPDAGQTGTGGRP